MTISYKTINLQFKFIIFLNKKKKKKRIKHKESKIQNISTNSADKDQRIEKTKILEETKSI
jgi:hypothetical protein